MNQQHRSEPALTAVADLAAEIRRLRIAAGLSQPELGSLVGYTKQYISLAERPKNGVPSRELVTALDKALNASGALLALHTAAKHEQRSLRSGFSDASIDDARTSLEKTLLSKATITDLDELAEETEAAAISGVVTPADNMLHELATLFARISSALQINQRPSVMSTLSGLAGRVAALIADEHMVLGNVTDSRAWHNTAWLAADESGNSRLRTDVRALAILLPLYYGSPIDMIAIADEAQELDEAHDGFGAAFAPLLKAVALAKLGERTQGRRTLAEARSRFSDVENKVRIDSIFGLSERRFLFYEGKALSLLGNTEKAWEVHQRALSLYPSNVATDPMLIKLDRATSMIRGRCISEGIEIASEALSQFPEDRRTKIILDAARQVGMSMPSKDRSSAYGRGLMKAIHSFLPLSPST